MIITLEGIDGSGKETQANLLKENLEKMGYKAVVKSFPNYEDENIGILGIREILSGNLDLGKYGNSMLYAMDRSISMKNIMKDIDNDTILILDRFTESNLIYQGRDLKSDKERIEFAEWLYDLEVNKLNIPRANLCILIDIPLKTSEKLRVGRELKAGTDKDIYEDDKDVLRKSKETSIFYAEKLNWKIINPMHNNELLPANNISELITPLVINEIEKRTKKKRP